MTQLRYILPPGEHRSLVTRLRELAGRLGVALAPMSLVELGSITRAPGEHVFASSTQPNVLVMRDGEIVAHGIGDLPMREIETLILAA
jgi:hypothetical protein